MSKKKDHQTIIDGLEVDDTGKPIYLHSIRTCRGYCDYACNTPQGDQVAEALEEVERLKAEIGRTQGVADALAEKDENIAGWKNVAMIAQYLCGSYNAEIARLKVEIAALVKK